MADDVRVTNFPNAGTYQAVALDMWKVLRTAHHEQVGSVDAELALYRRCLAAAFGKNDPKT